MNDQLVTAVETQHDQLEQAAGTVEAQPELTGGAVIVEVTDEDRITGCAHGVVGLNAMLERRRVDPHET